MTAFKRMTPQQRETYAALRTLGGEMMVSPQDVRQLHALKRRGLVRFFRIDGVKTARLRPNAATVRRLRREKRNMDFFVGVV